MHEALQIAFKGASLRVEPDPNVQAAAMVSLLFLLSLMIGSLRPCFGYEYESEAQQINNQKRLSSEHGAIIREFLLLMEDCCLELNLASNADEEIQLDQFMPYSLKVAHPDPFLCDPTVEQHAGFLDVAENRHLFFW